VGSHRGKWSAVSGYLEGAEQPLTRAVTEIREEVGLSAEQIKLTRIGEVLRAYDKENDIVWVVHPFLFNTETKSIKLDWENLEYRWVVPAELKAYDTVPKLRETFDRVRYDLQSSPAALTNVLRKVELLGEDKIHGATFIGNEAVRLFLEVSQASDAKDTRTFFSHLLIAGLRLRRVQPAMANVWNLVGKLLQSVDRYAIDGSSLQELRSLVSKIGVEVLEGAIKASEDASRNTAGISPQDGVVLTHSYSATVLRALELGFKAGRKFKVYATESHPGLEGKQLAKKLIELRIPVTLIADSAVNSIIHLVDLVLVGADSVLRDGSLIHKLGTLEIAAAARNHRIPVQSSCEFTKFSVQDYLGGRPELTHSFDSTPAELLSGYITEEGELPPTKVEQRIRLLQEEIYP